MEKKIANLGKPLSKEEMKEVVGGETPCNVLTDCPGYCTGDNNQLYGNVCISRTCRYVMCP
jgi:hypothetical protein